MKKGIFLSSLFKGGRKEELSRKKKKSTELTFKRVEVFRIL